MMKKTFQLAALIIICLLTWLLLGLPFSAFLRWLMGFDDFIHLSDIGSWFYVFRVVGLIMVCLGAVLLTAVAALILKKSLYWPKYLLIALLASQVFVGSLSCFFPQISFYGIITNGSIPIYTVYSERFSFKKFDKIEIGFHKEDVVKLLGRGFSRLNGVGVGFDSKIWVYSKPHKGESEYWSFQIVFDDNDLVSNKKAYYFYD